jgi:hypothetical protein
MCPEYHSQLLLFVLLCAGGIEQGALTLGPCMQFVDEWVLVEEREIALAMEGMLDWHSKLIEGESVMHAQ